MADDQKVRDAQLKQYNYILVVGKGGEVVKALDDELDAVEAELAWWPLISHYYNPIWQFYMTTSYGVAEWLVTHGKKLPPNECVPQQLRCVPCVTCVSLSADTTCHCW